MNKIKLICFTSIEELPPVITLVKTLEDLNIKVTLITMYNESDYVLSIFKNSLDYQYLDTKKPPKYAQKRSLARMVQYRMDRYKKLIVAKSVYRKLNKNETIWILHEETSYLLGKRIKNYNYFITLYELSMKVQLHKDNFLEEVCRTAKGVIVPEFCRAHIIRTIFNLEILPIILPNKQYSFDNESLIIEEEHKRLLTTLRNKNKTILVYTGIFIEERKLDSFFEVVAESSDKYELILLGHESIYLNYLLQKYKSSNIHFLGHIAAPNHLSIMEYADIGILTYYANDRSLNSVFCAPNKIYEYTYFSKPVIGNNIPGLKFLIENNGIGKCCDINNVVQVRQSLEDIINKYNIYANNTRKFYEDVDVEKIIKEIIGLDEKRN